MFEWEELGAYKRELSQVRPNQWQLRRNKKLNLVLLQREAGLREMAWEGWASRWDPAEPWMRQRLYQIRLKDFF